MILVRKAFPFILNIKKQLGLFNAKYTHIAMYYVWIKLPIVIITNKNFIYLPTISKQLKFQVSWVLRSSELLELLDLLNKFV